MSDVSRTRRFILSAHHKGSRRKFDEAVKAQTTNKTGLARQGLDMIQRIYRIEREALARNLSHAERKQLRDEKAKPL